MKQVLLSLVFVALLALPTYAQQAATAPAPTAPPPKPAPAARPPPAPPLTKDETAELQKAYAAAIQANPDLVTQQKDLKDKAKAVQDEIKALQQKINNAMIQADPTVAPILAAHPTARVGAPPAAPKETVELPHIFHPTQAAVQQSMGAYPEGPMGLLRSSV